MDKKAIFSELYNEQYAKVFRLCKGYFNGNEAVASDAVQEIFIKVWENLDSFRNQSKISTWLYRISVNVCLMHLRKSSSKKELNVSDFPHITAEQYADDYDKKLQKMYACINKLDEISKSIVLMMLEGIDYTEIAEVTGIKEDTLRVKIHRIKKSLTKCVSI